MRDTASAGDDRSVPHVDGEPLGPAVETTKLDDSHYVVRVHGYLGLASTPALEPVLVPLCWRPGARITLDISRADAIGSTALAPIRPAVVRLWSTQGDLEIVSQAGPVPRALGLAGLDRLDHSTRPRRTAAA